MFALFHDEVGLVIPLKQFMAESWQDHYIALSLPISLHCNSICLCEHIKSDKSTNISFFASNEPSSVYELKQFTQQAALEWLNNQAQSL